MNQDFAKSFEKSIITTYRKGLWARFIKGINKYHLIEDGDKIGIAMSGGKDSLLMAKLLQELQLHSLIDFEIEFISMDPGFNETNLDLHFGNAKMLGIPLNISKSNIFEIIQKKTDGYPCYLCARLRRKFLYNMAKEKGCNKLALGHHFDDVIETTLMNMFYAGTFKTMLPKVKSSNRGNLELIRPMYLIKEKDIIRIMNYYNIETMACGCEISYCDIASKRSETKKLIASLKETFDDIDKNIFRAAENVNLDRIARYTKNGKEYIYYNHSHDEE